MKSQEKSKIKDIPLCCNLNSMPYKPIIIRDACGAPRASPWHFITQASLDLNPGSLAILHISFTHGQARGTLPFGLLEEVTLDVQDTDDGPKLVVHRIAEQGEE